MTTPLFFEITLKCPKCKVVSNYYDKQDIVCDYCAYDIRVNGELVQYKWELGK